MLESISQEELCSFARSYALCNTDMALALVERYWQPDATDYKQVVDACFVHPFVVCTKFEESLDWNAVTEDVSALLQKIREEKEGKNIIDAAQMALYLLVRTCEEYEKDHPYKVYYDETWRERWRPLMDSVRECHKIVCELLVDGVNRIPGCYTPLPMGAFYTVAKLQVDDAEKFCAWCLSDFLYKDETTETLKPSGTKGLPVTGETIMMAPAAGFYMTPGLGKNQVRLAYVLCKEDIQRALMILEKAIEEYYK